MKYGIKHIILTVLGCVALLLAQAQQALTTISGTVSKPGNYEISLGGKNSDKSFRVAKYILGPANKQFVMTVPALEGISYNLQVTQLKEGHRRLEVDTMVQVPLVLNKTSNLTVDIHPENFKKANKGIRITKNGRLPKTTQVIGHVKGAITGADLSFEKVVDGQLQTVQTYFIAKGDSTFYFNIPLLEEGMYYLSTLSGKKSIYLKPGDLLDLALDLYNGTEVSNKKTTEENSWIAKWEAIKKPLILMNRLSSKTDVPTFTATYEPLQPQVNAFLTRIKSGNPKFDQLFRTAVQLDNNLLALNILLKNSKEKRGAYTINSKDFLQVPDYYKNLLAKNKLSATELLQLGDGYQYLNMSARFTLNNMTDSERNVLSDAERVALMMHATDNEALKPFVLKAQLDEMEERMSNYSEFKESFMDYQKYSTARPIIRKKYEGMLNMFVADTAFIGKPANDFNLPDTKGEIKNMATFKGKVVLIDVWATWCGPCKAQIPFLKEIEEEYKDNSNIVFLGISLDSDKDHQKWLDVIKEKDLHGVQLRDDRGKAFGKKYGLTAIPRFMLIDKNGNWAEVRCPLPENKIKLKKYIDRELARKM